MLIFQPERTLLRKQIATYAHYITGRVLDVGGGEVHRYKNLFSCDTYTCMDVYEGVGVDVVGSADAIPFENESFDSIVCTQVFEHLAFPEKSAQEISRVLKKGGYVLITVPQWNELHEEPNDYWRYTRFGISALFERNGFETIHYEQRGGFYTTLAQMHTRFTIDKYDLHHKPFIGRCMSKLFKLYGTIAFWRDSRDQSIANRKHTIGWCFMFRKV